MSWRTLFLEINLPGELCSGLIICWRKIAGALSPGEKFLGEKCDEFCYVILSHAILMLSNANVMQC